MVRIAFCGKMGSGKTMLANYLVENYGFKRLSFANEMKNQVANFLGITREELDRDKHQYRRLLQEAGNNKRKAQGSDYWIKIFKAKYGGIIHAWDTCVDDCRYINEVSALREEGFTIVYVYADDCIREGRIGPIDVESANFISENEIGEQMADYIINSNKTKEFAFQQLEQIYESLSRKIIINKDVREESASNLQ